MTDDDDWRQEPRASVVSVGHSVTGRLWQQ